MSDFFFLLSLLARGKEKHQSKAYPACWRSHSHFLFSALSSPPLPLFYPAVAVSLHMTQVSVLGSSCDFHAYTSPPLFTKDARMKTPSLPIFALISSVLFWTCWIADQRKLCLEVVANITYQCMELDLSEVPAEIPSSAQNLDLSFNPLGTLVPKGFSMLPDLRMLDLTRCQIQVIEDDAFRGLCNLSTLILTGNPVQRLGASAFSGLKMLQKLVAVEMQVVSLEDLPLGHLTALRELNLGHNFIRSSKLPSYFAHLVSLQYLNLYKNKISMILLEDLNVLKQRQQPLLTLVLSLNNILNIELGSFEGLHLQALEMRGCFNDVNVTKTCINALAGLQVHQLVLGDFRENHNDMPEDFGVFDGLCKVDIEEFRIVYYKGLIYNTNIFSNCLLNVSVLRVVSTSLNEVANLPAATRWQTLHFNRCGFSEVPAKSLRPLTQLKELQITENDELKEFEQDFCLPNLESLDLSRNRLNFKSCCSETLFGTPRLKHLNLSFNFHIDITVNFMGLVELQYLDLQHSKLNGPGHFSAFVLLTKLIYLDISYTNTHIDSAGTFYGLESLQVLKMAGNTFHNRFLKDNFRNVTRLLYLDISNCQLEQVSHQAFTSLHQLQELNISHNKLLTFPVACAPLQSLKVLDCSFNLIAAPEEEALRSLSQTLVRLDLSQNPLDCFCDHLGFLQWVKDHRKQLWKPERMTCARPSDLANTLVLDFKPSVCEVKRILMWVSVVGVLAIAFIVVLVYKFYFHLMLLSGCKRYGPGGNTYDAFVIYSSQDEEWVRNELVKNLEEGVPPFQLCLHYRDFMPGVAITSNIIQEGFHKSRKVIVVVSKHFMESRWCSFEFEIAQTWQFLESQAGIILIVLQKVDKSQLQRRMGLSRYLHRNTYLEWEDNKISRHIFWRRLRNALLDGSVPSGIREKVGT
uniref:Toll-like receptor 4 n=2 Tax=Ornithorhynchus anatinus TaxID=9258 RepID=F7A0Y2_ORNAN